VKFQRFPHLVRIQTFFLAKAKMRVFEACTSARFADQQLTVAKAFNDLMESITDLVISSPTLRDQKLYNVSNLMELSFDSSTFAYLATLHPLTRMERLMGRFKIMLEQLQMEEPVAMEELSAARDLFAAAGEQLDRLTADTPPAGPHNDVRYYRQGGRRHA